MSLTRRIAKNTIALSGAHIIGRVLSFSLVMVVARHYKTELFGQYTFSLSFVELFMVLASLGLEKVLTRDIARNPELGGKYLSDAMLLKLIYVFITISLMLLVLTFLGYSENVKLITLIFALRSVFDSFTGLFTSVFKGHQKMEYIPPLNIGGILIVLILGFTFIHLEYDIVYVVCAFAFSSVIKFVYGFIVIYRKFYKPVFKFNLSDIILLAKRAMPFGVGSVFVRIFSRIDTIMLSKLTTMTVVGYYNASYNLVIVLLFLPGAFNEAIYPVMSRFYTRSKLDFHKITEYSLKYSMIIGIPSATGIFILSPYIIQLFYGDTYGHQSVMALQILIWTLAGSFGTYIFTTTLNSANKEKHVTFIVIGCSTVNIILNIILIPKWSLYGASIATVITEAVFFVSSYLTARRLVFKIKLIRYIVKPSFASIVMYMAMYYLKSVHMIVSIVVGAVVYFLVLYLMRTFDFNDRKFLNSVLQKSGNAHSVENEE